MPNINPRSAWREAIQKKCTEIKNNLLVKIYIFPKLQRQQRGEHKSTNPNRTSTYCYPNFIYSNMGLLLLQ